MVDVRALRLAAVLVAGCAGAGEVPVERLPVPLRMYGFSFQVPQHDGWVLAKRTGHARDSRETLRFMKAEPDRNWVIEVDTFTTNVPVETPQEVVRSIAAFRGWSTGHLEQFGRDPWQPVQIHGAPCARASRGHTIAAPPPLGRPPWAEYVRYTARDVALICSVPHVRGQFVKFRLARFRPIGPDDRMPGWLADALRLDGQDMSFDAVAAPFIASVRYTSPQ